MAGTERQALCSGGMGGLCERANLNGATSGHAKPPRRGLRDMSRSVELWQRVSQAAQRESGYEAPESAVTHVRNAFVMAQPLKPRAVWRFRDWCWTTFGGQQSRGSVPPPLCPAGDLQGRANPDRNAARAGASYRWRKHRRASVPLWRAGRRPGGITGDRQLLQEPHWRKRPPIALANSSLASCRKRICEFPSES